MPRASPADRTTDHCCRSASRLSVGVALHARTQKIISSTGSTPPPAVAPLLTGEDAIFVGPYNDGEHDPTSQQCVDGTTRVKPQGGMRAVEGVLNKSSERSSAGSRGGAARTTGSRFRTSYTPNEAAVDTSSDGLIKTGFGPTVFLPPRLLVSRSKGPDARSKVPAACREGVSASLVSLNAERLLWVRIGV